MTALANIKKATWRTFKFKNEKDLPIVTPFKLTPNRKDGMGTITVDCTKVKGFPKIPGCDNARVRVRMYEKDLEQFGVEELLAQAVKHEPAFGAPALAHDPSIPLDGDFNGETEEAAIKRINERFQILDEMTEAVAYSHVRSMIVSGPPGVGKSHGTERVLWEINGIEALAKVDVKYTFIKGSISPIGLYQQLFKHCEQDHVVVFDDCDEVLMDAISLSLLKAALDTSRKRVLSWNKESRALLESGTPDSFEFKGGVIFITNLDFLNVRSKLLAPHLEAMMSRSHYLNLDINTLRDKYLRIKGVVLGSGMLDEYDFSVEQRDEIMQFVKDNVSRLNELSLRTVIKIADLVRMKKGNGWQRIANITLMKKGA